MNSVWMLSVFFGDILHSFKSCVKPGKLYYKSSITADLTNVLEIVSLAKSQFKYVEIYYEAFGHVHSMFPNEIRNEAWI